MERLLPESNFFSFKTSEGFSEERRKKEKEEILRLIDVVTTQGTFKITNEGESYLQPVLISNDCRDELVKSLESTLNQCKEQTTRHI